MDIKTEIKTSINILLSDWNVFLIVLNIVMFPCYYNVTFNVTADTLGDMVAATGIV